MIIKCPICGEHIELVGVEAIPDGQRILCPYCKNKFYYNSRSCNQNVDEAETSNNEDTNNPINYADIESIPYVDLAPDEEILMIEKPSRRAHYLLLGLALLSILGQLILSIKLGRSPFSHILLAILIIGYVILKTSSTRYILTSKRLIKKEGTFTQRVSYVQLEDIANISYAQNFLQTGLFGDVYNLYITTSYSFKLKVLGLKKAMTLYQKIKSLKRGMED